MYRIYSPSARVCIFVTTRHLRCYKYSIYSNISLYKKGTVHHKKGHFEQIWGWGGGGHVPPGDLFGFVPIAKYALSPRNPWETLTQFLNPVSETKTTSSVASLKMYSCYVNFKALSLFISLEIHCFYSLWTQKYLHSRSK